MKEPEIRQPGRFVWRECGRAFITDFGKLHVSVRRRGRCGVDLQWRVAEVFGAQFLGSGWRDTLDDAILEAEALAIRETGLLERNMRVARSGKKRKSRAKGR